MSEVEADGDGSRRYVIRVLGVLDPEWSTRTGLRLSVKTREGRSPVSELSGVLPDQAALMGVLEQLYSRGARLLKVECLGPEDLAAPAADRPVAT